MTHVQLTIQGYPVNVWQADTQAEMTKGLIGVPHLDDDEGLMLPSGTGGIHTVGMMMPIDVLWLTNDGHTVAVDLNIPPNVRIPRRADFALELQGGWFKRHGLKHAVSGDCGGDCGCAKCGQHVGQALAERRGRGRRGARRLMSPASRIIPAYQRQAVQGNVTDAHFYGMTTPHGPLVQMVGRGGGGGGGGGGGAHLGPAPHAPHAPGPHGHVPFGGGNLHGPRPPHVPHGHHRPVHPHPHHPHHHPHHHDHDHDRGGGWFGFGMLWPWWDWGYSCDPCDPDCIVYDPTLDCDALQAGTAQVEGHPYSPPPSYAYTSAPMQR